MRDFALEDIPTETVAVLHRLVPVSDLPAFFQEAFGQVAGALPAAGGSISGPPFGWYHATPTDGVDVSAGFPVAGDVHTPDGGVVVVERPGGRAAVGTHVGPYDTLEETYGAMLAWLAAQSLAPRGDMWEEYLTPPEGDPTSWQTRIRIPVA